MRGQITIKMYMYAAHQSSDRLHPGRGLSPLRNSACSFARVCDLMDFVPTNLVRQLLNGPESSAPYSISHFIHFGMLHSFPCLAQGMALLHPRPELKPRVIESTLITALLLVGFHYLGCPVAYVFAFLISELRFLPLS